MKQLLALFAILLTVGSAHAQADKTPVVTKLPGEEKLSTRERAERDFLMPVRRKQVVADAPKAANEDITASPETDANNVTAHNNAPVSDEVRTVEEAAAPARETRLVHAHAARRVHHTTRSMHTKSSSKKHSAHSSKKSSSKAHSKSSSKRSSSKKASSKKSSAHKSSKSASAKKKSSHKRRR